jgi:hypothetical protein
MDRSQAKISRLPRVLRDEFNRKMDDGMKYKDLMDWVRPHIPDINSVNVSGWYKGGHQRWLAEQERLEDMRHQREFAMQAVKDNQGSLVYEAAVQLAASQAYAVLLECSSAKLRKNLNNDPQKWARMITGLAKLSDQGLKHIRHTQEVKARIQKEIELDKAKKGKGGISAATLARIERELNLL